MLRLKFKGISRVPLKGSIGVPFKGPIGVGFRVSGLGDLGRTWFSF